MSRLSDRPASRFLDEVTKTASTWNGALSHSTTSLNKYGACLDYFAKCGTYVNRKQEQVDADMVKIFSDDEDAALRIVFGLRLITRKPFQGGIEEVQTGYGRRDEFYKCVVWMHYNRTALLYKNLHLIPVFGCWRDFLTEPLISTLDRAEVYRLFANNLEDSLLRKYLPQINAKKRKVKDGLHPVKDGKIVTYDGSKRSQARLAWARGFAAFLNISPRWYRKLKSQGTAHIWQKQMCRNQWDQINFNGVPGRAMNRHTTQKNKKDNLTVFERHNQVKRLTDWLLTQKTVKFTGYPYELMKALREPGKAGLLQKLVIDKQFETCIAPMKEHSLGNVLACLDISGSMLSEVAKGVSAYDICMSMGLAFSYFNTGYFQDVVCGFSDTPVHVKLKGTFSERFNQLKQDQGFQRVAWGSTNFQGVIDLICRVRKDNPTIPVSEFPETVLVISDMQFNPASGAGVWPFRGPRPGETETNYEAARRKLNAVGLPDVRIIWWWVNGTPTDFPSKLTDKGCYMIGGFDPVNIKALMGLSSQPKLTVQNGELTLKDNKDFDAAAKKDETPLDGMVNFLSQPIFNLIN